MYKKRPRRDNLGKYTKGSIPTNKIILPEKELRQLYIEKGYGGRIIARHFKVSKPTVYRNLKEYNIQIRRSGVPMQLPEYWKQALRKPKTKPVWNKGLTKDNNESLMKISQSLKGKYRKPEIHTNELVECKCGCNQSRPKYDKKGRIRQYIKGHNKKGYFKKGHIAWNKGKEWDSEIVRKMLIIRSPNKEETYLINLFKEHNIPYKFVGDGKIIIENRCPDFINYNGQKKIIEFFGEHWHKIEDEQIKRDIYSKYGYETLFIWGKELKNKKELLNKVKLFDEI